MRLLIKAIFLLILLSGAFILIADVKGDSVKTAGREALPKLLDLGAKKCIPCKMMAPILDELTEEYAGVFEVEFIDVWLPENEKRAEEYNISLIPTQIFFDAEGKELWRHEGFLAKEDILAKWKELGYNFKPVATKRSSSSGN